MTADDAEHGRGGREEELTLSVLALELAAEAESLLTEVSRRESTELDHFFEPTMQGMLHGGVCVRRGVS